MSESMNKGGPRPFARFGFFAVLWLFLLPSLVALATFTYYPNLETAKYSFFKWDGSSVEEFRNIENFKTIFTADPLFWQCFALIGILLAANLVKMWPSIFTAIVLHRLKSEKWQFFYRVLFVIPMVIPGLVGLLLWKAYFDADMGVINRTLNATGLMSVLQWLDGTMPVVARGINTTVAPVISWVFGSMWGLALFGGSLLLMRGGVRTISKVWMIWLPVLGFGLIAWGQPIDPATPWTPGVLATGFAVRGTLMLVAAAGIVEWLRRKDPVLAGGRIAMLAWGAIACGALLVVLSKIWTQPTGCFQYGNPAWLGNSKLVVPAVILWGFPWIGTIGVLIYLAGLSNISKEVYEAAELDGIGFWGKIFRIEVPLIMTQVRINLIFMTIGTLGEYGFFLILLGPEGGPGNVGMTPGLYMYRQAFLEGYMGYACALGMVMFLGILYLTVLYQRHVKVEK